MTEMFSYEGFSNHHTRVLDLTSMDTSSLGSSARMFFNCTSLETIFTSDKFVTTYITKGDSMFEGCSKLYGGRGTIYDSSYVDSSYARHDDGYMSYNPGYFTFVTDQLLY